MSGEIIWKLRLRSKRERILAAWRSPADHVHFWSSTSVQSGDSFELTFPDGQVEKVVMHAESPSALVFEYFGSRVEIRLEEDKGGTDLILQNTGVREDEWCEVKAGWLNVLLPFKSWVDFGIDIRNHDPERSWDHGFADQ